MRSTARLTTARQRQETTTGGGPRRMTFTGAIGAICMFPLRAIIAACVKLGIHPNVLTFVGVVINVAGAYALGFGRFLLAGVIMIVANIFDFIDGKVAVQLQLQSRFGAFWDSTLDRFSAATASGDSSGAPSSGPTSARRFPTISGSSRFSRSSGWSRRSGWGTRWRTIAGWWRGWSEGWEIKN